MTLCEYGCGQEAAIFREKSKKLRNGRWQCAAHHLSCPAVIQTREQNNLLKFGVKNNFERYANDEKYNGTRKTAYEKKKHTMKERFGVEHQFQRPEVLAKGKRTMMERHGTTQPMHLPHAVEAMKATCVARYGVETPASLVNQARRSKIAEEWLDELEVLCRERWIEVRGKRYKVDGYDPDTKTIYEFYGDYWHGNPAKYPPEMINTQAHANMQELHHRTIVREAALVDAGYTVQKVWESDYRRGILFS